ncbi:MAG: ABC transporter permease subunit, partial [Rhodospirillales bacterium]|nr:ABC transporter permease subunit [Rhodospirillales bacterium]
AALRVVAGQLKKERVESIAVCFLHAYANPIHERRAGEILAEVFPEAVVSLSSEVSPKYREYERTSTTVANSYVGPVTATFLDGLRRTEPGWVDLARTMGATPWAVLRHIRLPAALPAAASGIRVAIAVAPIGAIVGEWVGSSQGLGYLMLHANARMQIDVMFAALLVLTAMGLALYFIMDFLLRRIVAWQPDTQANVSH